MFLLEKLEITEHGSLTPSLTAVQQVSSSVLTRTDTNAVIPCTVYRIASPVKGTVQDSVESFCSLRDPEHHLNQR